MDKSNSVVFDKFNCVFLSGLLILLFISGCAQPQGNSKHASNFKTDLKTRLDVAVDYIRDDRRALLVVDVSNPRKQHIRVWLIQVSRTDGQRVSAARRFYSGEDRRHQETFRLPLPEPGLKETLYVEVFDREGKLLITTEPIKTHSQEEKL